MATDLIARAQAGDEQAFGQLVEPYQRELQVHCYRILGSAQDAEDVVQETLLSAWRGLHGFEQRSSLRTWLYRIATSRCLNALRSARRRAPMNWPRRDVDPPEPTRLGEVVWLEPYPDLLLRDLPDDAPDPQAQYEAREAISLAFITALQLLPPRQRAALILRDVLDFRVSEAAEILQASEQSVSSALKRARADPRPSVAAAGTGAAAPALRRRAAARRPAHPGVRGGGRGRHRRPADRGRLADPAPRPAGVPGPRTRRAVLQPGLLAGPLPAGRHPGQRPARVRGIPARSARRGCTRTG